VCVLFYCLTASGYQRSRIVMYVSALLNAITAQYRNEYISLRVVCDARVVYLRMICVIVVILRSRLHILPAFNETMDVT
jgi:hypothetical protein